MALSDDELLDFDLTRLGSFKMAPRTLLAQLVAAQWAQLWADRIAEREMPGVDENFEAGMVNGLREIAAQLRQGDLLPGGTLYEEMNTETG
jgi:hypothetical protein